MKKKKNVQSSTGVINITNDADFRLVESYKALRTNLMFSLPVKDDIKCRKLLFTSAGPGEGKTTTTVNLAVTLSETETKVLLIDADMRKPTIQKYFHIESRVGLSNLLSGMNTKDECVQKISNMPNLDVIPSGILPPNPSELLSSSAMEKLLHDFESEYDYIIIDTPPVNVVTDALALVKLVDGVAFVTSQGRSTYPDIAKAVETLRFANANIIGVVMNRVHKESGKKRYGYGYGSYGSYGSYSYKYKYKSTEEDDDDDDDDDN